MPRPVDEAIGGARDGGFGPTAGASTNLGQIDVSTIHQLDVDGADANAKALAAVFDKAGNLGQKLVNQKIESNNKKDAALGEQAGLTGNVDKSKMDGDSGVLGISSAYADGVKRSQTQLQAFTVSEQARALFAQNPQASLMDSVDDKGNKVPGLMTQIDGMFAGAFPAGAKDPTVANIVAPIMQHTMNELTAESYKHKIVNDQQTAEDSAQASAMHDMQYGSSLFNAHQSLDTLTKVYGGNNRLGRDALVHSIGEAAVATGNPDSIAKYLPPGIDFGNGATLTPENQQYLDQAKTRAQEAANRNNTAAGKTAANNIVDSMLSGKDPTAQLHDYVKMPGANPELAMNMFNWYYRRGKEKEADSVDNNAATWDMDRGIANGSITNGGQILSFLTDRGIGNTKGGNQLLQRGMGNLRSFQNTNADDPDFKAGLGFVSSTYSASRDQVTGKFNHNEAAMQQAGAMKDYHLLYQSYIQQSNTSSSDAARKAQQAVFEKWGDAVEDPTGRMKGAFKAPKTDDEQAEIVRRSNPQEFNASGISARDIKSLRDSGMVSDSDAAKAAQLIIARTTKH